MKHRIVVLGAGYAGTSAAGMLARQLHSDDFEITVVNAEPDFVERLRLHQLAAGQELRHRPLAEVFAGTGIRLRVARVIEVDAGARAVAVADAAGIDLIEYDTLVYALGSIVAEHGVPGVAEHGFHVAARPAALRLRARLEELGEDGDVVVVGGNLTAIEAATEIAESRPGLRISLVTRGELGGWLGPKARRHLLRAFDRFGIAIHEHTSVTRVTEAAAIAGDGRVFASDATVWTAGFAANPLAAAAGFAVEADGRITVDRQLRSVSHPDVYVAGDSAYVIGDNGLPLPMSCASAGFTCTQATSAIIGDLTGRKIQTAALPYVGNHISLGRKDGILQLADKAGDAKPGAVCGRPAARVKSAIVAVSGWAISHPTFGKLDHRYRAAVTREHSPELVTG